MIVNQFLREVQDMTTKLRLKNQNLLNEFKIEMLTFQRQIKKNASNDRNQKNIQRKNTPSKDKNLSTRNQTWRFNQDKENIDPNLQEQVTNGLLDQYEEQKSIQINTYERNRNLQKFKSANDMFITKEKPQYLNIRQQPECAQFHHDQIYHDEQDNQQQNSFLSEFS